MNFVFLQMLDRDRTKIIVELVPLMLELLRCAPRSMLPDNQIARPLISEHPLRIGDLIWGNMVSVLLILVQELGIACR